MKILTRLVLGGSLIAGLSAAPEKPAEPDISAVLAAAPVKEREGLERLLRTPGPSGDIPTMVALNTINRFDDRTLPKIAAPLARLMAGFLENKEGNQRAYAFNKLTQLSDAFPGAAGIAKPVLERIAKDTNDPLRERAAKFLGQSPAERGAEEDARFDKFANQTLVGIWLEQDGPDDANPATNQFKADGTFESIVWESAERKVAKVTFRGKWVVKGGHLYYRTQYSSDAAIKFPQPDIKDKLVELGTSQLVYEAHDGTKLKMTRLTKAP